MRRSPFFDFASTLAALGELAGQLLHDAIVELGVTLRSSNVGLSFDVDIRKGRLGFDAWACVPWRASDLEHDTRRVPSWLDTEREAVRHTESTAEDEPADAHSSEFPCTCTGDPVASECMGCGVRACPAGEPLHFHHDGCPHCDFEGPLGSEDAFEPSESGEGLHVVGTPDPGTLAALAVTVRDAYSHTSSRIRAPGGVAVDPTVAAHAVLDDLIVNGWSDDVQRRPSTVERFASVIGSVGRQPEALRHSPMDLLHRAWGLAKSQPGYDKRAWMDAQALLQHPRICCLCENRGFYPYCQQCGREPTNHGIIYLAARYSRRNELRGYRAVLQQLGYEVKARWLDGTHEVRGDLAATAAHAERLRFALEDWEDLSLSAIVVSFSEPPRSTASRGGRHVELGAALAMGKRCLLVGPLENVFHALPQIEHHEDWPSALAALSAPVSSVADLESVQE